MIPVHVGRHDHADARRRPACRGQLIDHGPDFTVAQQQSVHQPVDRKLGRVFTSQPGVKQESGLRIDPPARPPAPDGDRSTMEPPPTTSASDPPFEAAVGKTENERPLGDCAAGKAAPMSGHFAGTGRRSSCALMSAAPPTSKAETPARSTAPGARPDRAEQGEKEQFEQSCPAA